MTAAWKTGLNWHSAVNVMKSHILFKQCASKTFMIQPYWLLRNTNHLNRKYLLKKHINTVLNTKTFTFMPFSY
jgi:hypothetical protein